MRRPAPSLAVSPKLLKHFAIATVVITGLLALFAGGEGWGVDAQVQARVAKNDLITKEAQKFGTARVSKSLVVRPGTSFAGDGDVGIDPASGDGAGGGGPAPMAPRGPADNARLPAYAPPPNLALAPGGKVSRSGLIESETAKNAKPRKPFRPNAQQKAALMQRSAERSGAPGID